MSCSWRNVFFASRVICVERELPIGKLSILPHICTVIIDAIPKYTALGSHSALFAALVTCMWRIKKIILHGSRYEHLLTAFQNYAILDGQLVPHTHMTHVTRPLSCQNVIVEVKCVVLPFCPFKWIFVVYRGFTPSCFWVLSKNNALWSWLWHW